MADKDKKKASSKGKGSDKGDKPSAATPRFDPKPVQVGGDSILDRLVPHMKKIIIVVVGTALILVVVFTFKWLADRKHEKATTQLAEVIDTANREVRAPGEKPAPDEKEPSFADPKARAEAVLEQLGQQSTNLAGPAYKASMLLQAGKIDDAIAAYQQAQNAKGIEGVLAREGLGIAFERKAEAETDSNARHKDYEDALAAFQAMQPDDKGPRRAWALYHQGRVLIQLGRNADAKTALQKAKDLGKDDAGSSDLVQLVDERLVGLGAG